MVGDAGIELMAIAAWHPFKATVKSAGNVSPPLTSASLAGPYRFEITANDVALPGDVLRVPVFLAVEEVTKHAYGEVAEATPENAAAFLARLAFRRRPTGLRPRS